MTGYQVPLAVNTNPPGLEFLRKFPHQAIHHAININYNRLSLL
jgi:hypothetical protein